MVVNRGTTRQTAASAITVDSAAPVPSGLNTARWWRSALTSRHMPTMPLRLIITAANTVSRARVEVSLPPETISDTISATSITVTATASTSEPKGSPTRWATTSAWCTADSTAPTSSSDRIPSTASSGWRPQAAASARMATIGTTVVQGSTVQGARRVMGQP